LSERDEIEVIDEMLDTTEEEWEGPGMGEELPPRPRNRLLAPLPLALIAVLLIAGGFLVGVLVQKESEGSGTPAGLPSGFPSLSGAEGGGALPSFSGGGSQSAVSGTVASVDGRTIYVKGSEGSTVAVRVEDGSKVSRNSSVGVKQIRPGDSVVVQGAKHGSTVKASLIAATESGVESSTQVAPTSSSSTQGGGEGASAELFGE
jgi:hypothetical protein